MREEEQSDLQAQDGPVAQAEVCSPARSGSSGQTLDIWFELKHQKKKKRIQN